MRARDIDKSLHKWNRATWHPTHGFLLKALKHFLGYPEYFEISKMHYKRRYQICICLVILVLDSFRINKGFSIIFPQILDAMKVKTFLIPLSITFFNPKILGFLFCTKKRNLGSVRWKIKPQKIVGNLLDIK